MGCSSSCLQVVAPCIQDVFASKSWQLVRVANKSLIIVPVTKESLAGATREGFKLYFLHTKHAGLLTMMLVFSSLESVAAIVFPKKPDPRAQGNFWSKPTGSMNSIEVLTLIKR